MEIFMYGAEVLGQMLDRSLDRKDQQVLFQQYLVQQDQQVHLVSLQLPLQHRQHLLSLATLGLILTLEKFMSTMIISG
jgi:hypothetical protein